MNDTRLSISTILLQRIGRAEHNKTLLIVSIVFIKSKYDFSNNIVYVRNSSFYDYKTFLKSSDSMQVAKITSIFYENNFQNKIGKTPTLYHNLDMAVL